MNRHQRELAHRREYVASMFGFPESEIKVWSATQLDHYYQTALSRDPWERLRLSLGRLKTAIWRALYLDVVFPWWR